MKRTWYVTVLVAGLVLWAAFALARSSGSPASRTGAPSVAGVSAESSCRGCHGGNALNSGGSVSILGVPALFRNGATYRLTVELASDQTSGASGRTWGFQMTAVDTATGQGAGTFSIVNATETGLVSGDGSYATRTYVNQITGGKRAGAASPVEWQVDWTAPASGTERVKFFVAGLAGDGNSSSGDWVYTASAATTDTTTPALPTTWGQIKAAYGK